MNERVKELMQAAGYAAPELAGRAQKLSELIVNECIKECEDYAAKVLKYSQFGANGATDCANILKEKLGTKNSEI